MRGRKIKTLFSYILIGAGAFLLFQGARNFLESRWGQRTAAREFQQEMPEAAPPTPAPARPELGEAIAKLTIPRLDAKLYIVEGVDTAELRRGPGHMPGTAMPGADGNCVIAGHRDTHFRVLKDIRRGDDIVLETNGGQFLYRVKSTQIVPPTDTAVLNPTTQPTLTVITCYPFYYLGAAPKRFIVRAELAGALNASSFPSETGRHPS